jgi:hypothetical protein
MPSAPQLLLCSELTYALLRRTPYHRGIVIVKWITARGLHVHLSRFTVPYLAVRRMELYHPHHPYHPERRPSLPASAADMLQWQVGKQSAYGCR